MKMSLRFTAGALLVLTMQAVCFAQHYRQTDLVSNTSGVAPVADPQLVNPWGLSRSSSGVWWISDNATGFGTLYNGAGAKQSLVITIPQADPNNYTHGDGSFTSERLRQRFNHGYTDARQSGCPARSCKP